MAGKSNGQSTKLNAEVVDETLSVEEPTVGNQATDWDNESDDGFSGGIIRPNRGGVVDVGDVANPRNAVDRMNEKEGNDNSVTTKSVDPGINLPSRNATEPGLVKIRVKSYVRAKIGLEYYELFPGEVVNVPENVRDVLKAGGKLEVV